MWLYEDSESNNSENGVISTSSCNTMTPIHQTPFTPGCSLEPSFLFLTSFFFFSRVSPPCGEYLAGISFLEKGGVGGEEKRRSKEGSSTSVFFFFLLEPSLQLRTEGWGGLSGVR